MARIREMVVAQSEGRSSGERIELRVTRDPAAKQGVYRVQSRTSASNVNTTVRIISPEMAKVAARG